VALVGALAAYTGQTLTRDAIAELAHQIELQDLGVLGGKQDQYAAAFGGFQALTFERDRVTSERILLTPARQAELEACSVVVYSGHARVSGDIHARVQASYRNRVADTLEALAIIRRVAREFRECLPEGPIDRLGELLSANWAAQKRLHAATSNAELETIFRIAERSGALGGKALGAGGGGCLYFLTHAENRPRLEQALRHAGADPLPVRFDRDGLQQIY
jgi:D-glycero-alpha-D-manno-heptose-7-phosphate kinase